MAYSFIESSLKYVAFNLSVLLALPLAASDVLKLIRPKEDPSYIFRQTFKSDLESFTVRYVSRQDLIVYSKPTTGSEKLDHLYFGEEVQIKSMSQDSWVELRTGGFVDSYGLSKTPTFEKVKAVDYDF